MNHVHIALITDGNYVIPTATTVYSIIKNKKSDTFLHIYLVTADFEEEQEKYFSDMQSDSTEVKIVRASAQKYAGLHTSDPNAPCVASVAALLKFDLPNIISEDKVLYVDGDLIVREDLSELYSTDLGDCYLAAVVDSGSIYYKHTLVKEIQDYFNSGVMLLNLKKMRDTNATEMLIEEKKKGDSFLMDQNVFNVVFNKKIKLLPIRYNLLYVNLLRAQGKYTIDEINQRYGTEYTSLEEIENDAAIVHYSSKDKPWKSFNVPLGEEWRSYFKEANDKYGFASEESASKINPDVAVPKVSVIVPVFNTGRYLKESLDSVANQSLSEIEIICVNDGSTDNSLEILNQFQEKDSRFKVFSQQNSGQSAARNKGISEARGEYIYFFDSDDLLVPNALKKLYEYSVVNALDLLLFDGTSFYESKQMEESFPHYATHYIRNKDYPGVREGTKLYVDMVNNGDYKVSPCLQFFHTDYLNKNSLRYYEGIIYEDNLFALQSLLSAKRVGYLKDKLFNRRVRNGSTITAKMTFRNFRGYFTCLMSMYLFILENNFDDNVIATANRQFNFFMKTTVSCYSALEPADQRKPWYSTRKERLFADLLYENLLMQCDKETIKQVSYSEFNEIKNSKSYKIGRFITWLPRKIRGGFRCLKENGFKYTVKRVLVHLHMKKDN